MAADDNVVSLSGFKAKRRARAMAIEKAKAIARAAQLDALDRGLLPFAVLGATSDQERTAVIMRCIDDNPAGDEPAGQ